MYAWEGLIIKKGVIAGCHPLTNITIQMNKSTLKSISAVLAGFVLVIVLSFATDLFMIKSGRMKQPFDLNSTGFIIFVVFYRSLFGIAGSYLTAALSPNRPMRHAMIGGFIGFFMSILGAVAMWDKPPHWYPVALILTVLPCAWTGGRLWGANRQHAA